MRIFIKNFIPYLIAFIYRAIWYLLFPFIYFYFLFRSIKEPGYENNFLERLVLYKSQFQNAIWFHAVSLGELRAARPIFYKLLKNNERLLLTTLTLAGRIAAQKEFKDQIHKGEVAVFYNPLEFDFLFYKFIRKHNPKFCVILECDLWPVMISSIKRVGVPLVFAQAQYPERGFKRDRSFPFLKGNLIKEFDFILAKSQKHLKRFEFFGGKKISIMGDMRFELDIPKNHLKMADSFKRRFLKNHFTICFASIGKKEDKIIVEVMRRILQNSQRAENLRFFFVFVPRHPNDFKNCDRLFKGTSIRIKKRSELFEDNLNPAKRLALDHKIMDFDAIWGDSLGELNFYMSLSDIVFMGDSFNEEGSHNIIEPFALEKPVLVGPSIWGIEYPAMEALEAKILKQVFSKEELIKELWNFGEKLKKNDRDLEILNTNLSSFYKLHSGATKRFYDMLKNKNLITPEIRLEVKNKIKKKQKI